MAVLYNIAIVCVCVCVYWEGGEIKRDIHVN